MAACGSLRSLFEKPRPENPTLMESLSHWNHIHLKKPIDPSSLTELFGELNFEEKSAGGRPPPLPPAQTHIVLKKPVDPSSLTELFGELNFEEKPPRPRSPSPPAQSPWLDIASLGKHKDDGEIPSLDSLLREDKAAAKGGGGFSLRRTKSLQLCTEGLGSESTDVDADDVMKDAVPDMGGSGSGGDDDASPEKASADSECASYYTDVRPRNGAGFPPPIQSMRKAGKRPGTCFKSFREEGRFVLREMRMPGQELLHASREGGRLRLRFVLADDDGAAAAPANVADEARMN